MNFAFNFALRKAPRLIKKKRVNKWEKQVQPKMHALVKGNAFIAKCIQQVVYVRWRKEKTCVEDAQPARAQQDIIADPP